MPLHAACNKQARAAVCTTQATQLQSMRSNLPAHNKSSSGGGGHVVLLELMLVDAQLPQPSSSGWLSPQLASTGLLHGSSGMAASKAPPAAADAQTVSLSVLVSAAANLPLVPG